MRIPAVLAFAVVASLMAYQDAQSGEHDLASSKWLENLFRDTSASRYEKREAELKALMEIRSEQETAWLEYVLARRGYAKVIGYRQRQEMKDFAAGNTGFETTLSSPDADSSVLAAKLALKTKFEALYTILDEIQKARADRALTPSECGR
jgi:hypothetical protein